MVPTPFNGTARPYLYFQKYRKEGAPLTFVIQNGTPHCCVNNMMPLILLWLDAVIRQRQPAPGQGLLRAIDPKRGWIGNLEVEDSGIKDTWRTKVWNASSAAAVPFRQGLAGESGHEILLSSVTDGSVPSAGALASSWLPSREFAEAWLAFEAAKEHPITPLE